MRLGDGQARDAAFQRLEDKQTPEADRAALADILGETQIEESAPLLTKLLSEGSPRLQGAALSALQHFPT